MKQYIAFMGHIDHSQFDYLETTLNEYNIGGYVIAHEKEPYSHFHFLVEMEEQDYTNFRKRVFIDKFKLKGQARDGKPRQYGKVKEIIDFQKMLSYTLKDEDFRTNLEQEQIDNAIDQSFKKEKPKLLKEKMVKYIDDKNTNEFGVRRYASKKRVMLFIVAFCKEHKIAITKGIINSYYLFFRQFSTDKKNLYDDESILRNILGDYEYNDLI